MKDKKKHKLIEKRKEFLKYKKEKWKQERKKILFSKLKQQYNIQKVVQQKQWSQKLLNKKKKELYNKLYKKPNLLKHLKQ